MEEEVIEPRLIGTVKWFSDKLGYGFVIAGGCEYFVHFRHVPEGQFTKRRLLFAGNRVEFTPFTDNTGPKARDILVIKNTVTCKSM